VITDQQNLNGLLYLCLNGEYHILARDLADEVTSRSRRPEA